MTKRKSDCNKSDDEKHEDQNATGSDSDMIKLDDLESGGKYTKNLPNEQNEEYNKRKGGENKKSCDCDPNKPHVCFPKCFTKWKPQIYYIDAGGYSNEGTTGSRNRFLLIVLTLVLIMFLVTAAFNFFVHNNDDMREFFIDYSLLISIPAVILSLGVTYAIAYSPCSTRPPMSIICMVLITIALSLITAVATVKFSTTLIFYAIVSTAFVVLVCLMLACTPFDFTKFWIYLITIAAAFFGSALLINMVMFFGGYYFKPLHIALLIIGTIIQAAILTTEMQMIIGGKSLELEEEAYAIGAIMLYSSIIHIFLKLLRLIGLFSDDD